MNENEDDEISPLAMSIMGSVAYGGQLPLSVSYRDVDRLSDYEALVIDRAIRKQGLRLSNCPSHEEFLIENEDDAA